MCHKRILCSFFVSFLLPSFLFHTRTGYESPEGEKRYRFTLFLTSSLNVGRWSTPSPGLFTPGKDTVLIVLGGWVGTRVGLNGCGKISLHQGFESRTVQPVASPYTDWTIPVHEICDLRTWICPAGFGVLRRRSCFTTSFLSLFTARKIYFLFWTH